MKTFVNLPVQNLTKSKAFFSGLGLPFNEQFSDETSASLVISDDAYVMLLEHGRFKDFTKKSIADARSTTEVILAISVDSKAEVDEFLNKALRSGGQEARDAQDHGFMFTRSFEDPDGHIWEVIWMDPSTVQ